MASAVAAKPSFLLLCSPHFSKMCVYVVHACLYQYFAVGVHTWEVHVQACGGAYMEGACGGVYMGGACASVCALCASAWRLKADAECLPPSLPTFHFEAVSH